MSMRNFVISQLEELLATLRRKDETVARDPKAQSYDYMPLFIWDRSLSGTAKTIMSLLSGSKNTRDDTLTKLRAMFPSTAIDAIENAISELEKLGYLSSEAYRGKYGEPRVDQRICVCPRTRLPKIVEPQGRKPVFQRSADEMCRVAMDLGFIAETGKDTTYLLYDAMRIFSAVEDQLRENEFVVFPIIGPESVRHGLEDQSMLRQYPHCILGIIITTQRVIICQEDCSPEGRCAGLARFVYKDFCQIKSVSMDERLGRVTFSDHHDSWDSVFSVDLISAFGVDNFERYYAEVLAMLPSGERLPKMTFFREEVR